MNSINITNIIYAVLVLGIMGGVFGLVLAIASKVFAVKTDPRLEEITACLAGANCGGCGFPGCGGCADAILNGKAPVNACAPAGADAAKQIAAIMGVEAVESARMVAQVRCNGGTNAKKRFEYRGVHDCTAATKVAAGPLECAFGCFGFGSCVAACQFDAMHIGHNGTAVVDRDKCTNCMACAAACPRNLIISMPYDSAVVAPCASKDKGVAAKAMCDVSCIACKICEKNCPAAAIVVVDNCAVIDYTKCTSCGTCVTKCPRKLILDLSGKVVTAPAAPKAAPVAPAPAVSPAPAETASGETPKAE